MQGLTAKQVGRLSLPQRELIMRHVALGEVPFVAGSPAGQAARVLISLKILKPHQPGSWRTTRLTLVGREVACMVMAEYAEALILAGAGRTPLEELLDRKTPMERLEEMKKIINEREAETANALQNGANIGEIPPEAIPHQ